MKNQHGHWVYGCRWVERTVQGEDNTSDLRLLMGQDGYATGSCPPGGDATQAINARNKKTLFVQAKTESSTKNRLATQDNKTNLRIMRIKVPLVRARLFKSNRFKSTFL